MSKQRPVLEDVLDVLEHVRKVREEDGAALTAKQLRQKAVALVALRELESGRFANDASALHSIQDACSRRLGGKIADFDRALGELYEGDPTSLRKMLEPLPKDSAQERTIRRLLVVTEPGLEGKRRRSSNTNEVGWRETIARMVATVEQTVAGANGQSVVRTMKNKDLRFATSEALGLAIEELLQAQDRRCAITGIPLQEDHECEDEELRCSLDRKDSNGHYEPGNLQLVCRFVNRWKNDDNDENFRRLIQLVRHASRS